MSLLCLLLTYYSLFFLTTSFTHNGCHCHLSIHSVYVTSTPRAFHHPVTWMTVKGKVFSRIVPPHPHPQHPQKKLKAILCRCNWPVFVTFRFSFYLLFSFNRFFFFLFISSSLSPAKDVNKLLFLGGGGSATGSRSFPDYGCFGDLVFP